MGAIKARVRKEIRELVPVTIFFLLAFELLALTQRLLLAEHGGGASAYAGAAIGALLVAKVVIIIDHFPIMRRFTDRPLIYAIVWSALVYFVVATIVRYAEHLVRAWRATGDFIQANEQLLNETAWSRVLLIHIWLFVILAVFCTFRAVVRTTGSKDLLELLLTRRRERLETSQAAPTRAGRATGD